MDEILPPFLFAGASRSERRWQAQLRAAGRIRSIGPRVYSSLPAGADETTVPRAWSTIVAGLFPGVLLSHRSALEFMPSPDGEIFLTGTSNRVVSYPGLQLVFNRGPRPRDDDARFLTLHSSSRARAFLENLAPERRTKRARTLSAEQLEERLEQILNVEGEPALNALRDHARTIAAAFRWSGELGALESLIGTLLGTRTARLKSATGRARAAGMPFDTNCLSRLQILFAELKTRPLRELPDRFEAPDHHTNKAFFDAYFSNFIEGTTFAIEEAEAIVFDRQLPADRPTDAHDILGTFEIVSNPNEMRRTPSSFAELLELLRARHGRMLANRPDVRPGLFKTTRNRAGDTHFVSPDYVEGTLFKAYELYADVPPGLARAIFMVFMVSDVHPFEDGNGRTARVMMNAELCARGLTTIIVPTVFREDYLLSLRALTRRERPAPLVDAMVKAHAFSHREFAPYPGALQALQARHWFREPEQGRIVVN